MFTALTPFARGLAMATILVSLAVAAGRAPAAQAKWQRFRPRRLHPVPGTPGTSNPRSAEADGQGQCRADPGAGL